MSETEADRSARVSQFITVLPFSKELGLTLDMVSSGRAIMTLPYNPRFIGDPDTGVLHGGVVSALIDTTCGAAVVSHPDAGTSTATLDLRIDYMRPAKPGQAVRAEAECTHVTRHVVFVTAKAFDDDPLHPLAQASGAFTVPASPATAS